MSEKQTGMKDLYNKALDVYANEPCARTLDEDVIWHLRHGHVFMTDEYFVLMRPTRVDWGEDLLIDSTVGLDEDETPDCWFVTLMVGELCDVHKFFPYYLPFVGYQVKNELRIAKTSTFARLTYGQSRRKESRTRSENRSSESVV